jgi:hypothetical protein
MIPKFLINLDNNTGLYYLIHYWNKYSDNIYLVIHSKFNLITTFYIKEILPQFESKIKIINYDYSNGTALTLSNILNNELKDISCNNLLITWCDLYPIEDINFKKLKKNRAFNNIYVLTNGNKCRYNLTTDNEILNVPESNGNIIGIYYFQNYKRFQLDSSRSLNNDIVIFLSELGKIHNLPLKNIVDFGDQEKLLNIFSQKDNKTLNCRYFNSLSLIHTDKLLKKGLEENGKKIIQKEMEWYRYINNLENKSFINYLPIIYEYYDSAYLMEYKREYSPLYQFLNKYKNEINSLESVDEKENKIREYNILKVDILKNVMSKIDLLHNIESINVSKKIFINNLKREVFDKVINRKVKIDNLLNYFGNIKIVNNLTILPFKDILEKCKNILTNYYETVDDYQYSIILGDSTFSNILIDPENLSNIIFIDPRGYFGESLIHGPIEYDYAKILYSLSGYDSFNNGHFNIKSIDNDRLELEIKSIDIPDKILNYYFNKVHEAYVVIIWLSLAEYCKNDIWKCLAAYYYGLYLGTKL